MLTKLLGLAILTSSFSASFPDNFDCTAACGGKPCWCIRNCSQVIDRPQPPLNNNIPITGTAMYFNKNYDDDKYCFYFESLNGAPLFEPPGLLDEFHCEAMLDSIVSTAESTCYRTHKGQGRAMFHAALPEPAKLKRTSKLHGTWKQFEGMGTVVTNLYGTGNQSALLFTPPFDEFGSTCVVLYDFKPVISSPVEYALKPVTSSPVTSDVTNVVIASDWYGYVTLSNANVNSHLEEFSDFMVAVAGCVITFSGISLMVFRFVQAREKDIRHAGKLEVSLAVAECTLGLYLLIWLKAFEAMGSCGHADGDPSKTYPAVIFHAVLMLVYGYQFALYNSLFDQLRDPLAPAMPGSTSFRGYLMVVSFLSCSLIMAIDEGTNTNYTYSFNRQVKFALTGGFFLALVLVYTLRYLYHGLAIWYCCMSSLMLSVSIELLTFTNLKGEQDNYEFGLTPLGLCWVSQTQDGLNIPMWLSFYIPVCAAAIGGVTSLLMVFMLFSHHDEEPDQEDEIENQAQYAFTMQKTEHVTRVGILVAQQVLFVVLVMTVFFIDSQSEEQVFCTKTLGMYFGMTVVLYSVGSLLRSLVVLHRSLRKIPLGQEYQPLNQGGSIDKGLRRFMFLKFVEEVRLTIEDEDEENSESGFSASTEEVSRKLSGCWGACLACLYWWIGQSHNAATSGTRGWRYNRSAEFRQLRQHWNIQDHYKATFHKLAKLQNQRGEKLYKEGQDHGGKSGSFMFHLHHSEQYIVKAIPPEEAEMFLQNSVFDKYKERMLSGAGDDSFLVKVLGVYRTHVSSLQDSVYFQVLEKLGHGLNPELAFDLKGSGNRGDLKIRKDQLLREMLTAAPGSGEERIEFELDEPIHFMETIAKDVQMLEDAKLIDYSLLIFAVKSEEAGMRDLRRQVQDVLTDFEERIVETHHSKAFSVLPEAVKEKLSNTVEEVEMGLKNIDENLGTFLEGRITRMPELRETMDDPAQGFQRTHTMGRQEAYDWLNSYCETFLPKEIEQLQKLMRKSSKVHGGTEIERALTLYISSLQLLKEWITRRALAYQHEAKVEERSPLHSKIRRSGGSSQSLAWGDEGGQLIGRCTHYTPGEDGREVRHDYDVACCIIDIASCWGPDKQLNEIGKSLLGPKGGGGAAGWLHPNDWGISAKPKKMYSLRFKDACFRYLNPEYRSEAPLPYRLKVCRTPLFPKLYTLEARGVANPSRTAAFFNALSTSTSDAANIKDDGDGDLETDDMNGNNNGVHMSNFSHSPKGHDDDFTVDV